MVGLAMAATARAVEWVQMDSPTTVELNAIWGTSGTNVYVVGDDGTFLHYDGTSWQIVPGYPFAGDQYADAMGIWGSGPNDIWIVGGYWHGPYDEQSFIIHFDGSTFNIVQDHISGYGRLNCVWGTSPDNVYAAGGLHTPATIYHYNGTQWQLEYNGTEGNLPGLWGSSPTDIYAVGGHPSAEVIHWDGNNWTPMSSLPMSYSMYEIWGSGPNDIFAVNGDNYTVYHYDGTQWSAMSSPHTKNLYAVWGSASDNVYAGGEDGVLLHYDGNAWSSITSNTSGHIGNIWGTDANNIFAVAGNGDILHYYIPETTPAKALWCKESSNPVIAASGPSDSSWYDSCVLYDGGQYRMWVSNYRNIYYATSSDGVTWGSPQIQITRGSYYGIGNPCVIKDTDASSNERYKMWYHGHNNDYNSAINYATSPDGVNWTQHGEVLTSGGHPLGYDDFYAVTPDVVKTATGYVMYYQGGAVNNGVYRILRATSSDGVNWTKSSQPALEADGTGFDAFSVYPASIMYMNGLYYLFYTGEDVEASQNPGYTRQTGLAWSTDGVTFYRFDEPVLSIGANGSFDDKTVYGASVVEVNGAYRMYYTGYSTSSGTGLSSIGLAYGQALKVTHPDGDHLLASDSYVGPQSYTIQWEPAGSCWAGQVTLEYTDNGGFTWNTIDTVANSGSYSWALPTVTSDHCKIRVSRADEPQVYDDSNYFTLSECQTGGWSVADLNNDCFVEWADFGIFASNWQACGQQYDPKCNVE